VMSATTLERDCGYRLGACDEHRWPVRRPLRMVSTEGSSDCCQLNFKGRMPIIGGAYSAGPSDAVDRQAQGRRQPGADLHGFQSSRARNWCATCVDHNTAVCTRTHGLGCYAAA